jgi:hypothetical protein
MIFGNSTQAVLKFPKLTTQAYIAKRLYRRWHLKRESLFSEMQGGG